VRTVTSGISGIITIGMLAGSVIGAAAQSEEPAKDGAGPQLTEALAYSQDPKQVIYAYELEPSDGPRPAVVHFHGGGLVEGEPLEDAEWAGSFAELGYVTFLAGYRLLDEATGENLWPAQLEDAQQAIQWVRANADRFNVDPERVCASGFSSGGLLSSFVGMTDAATSSDAGGSTTSSRADCVITLSGDNDYLVPYAYPAWTRTLEILLGGTVEDVPDRWEAASPAHSVDAETVPFLIIHGNLDTVNPVEMSRNLASALAEAGREYIYAEVAASHEGVMDHETTRKLLEAFLASQLHPDA
jgi:acetyl esterase/lipase